MCSSTTQTPESYQTSSKLCWHRDDHLFMYEAGHKLQVTYGFFPPGEKRRGDECMVAVNASELIASVTSERARSMSDQCFWPWRKAVIQHQHGLLFCSSSLQFSVWVNSCSHTGFPAIKHSFDSMLFILPDTKSGAIKPRQKIRFHSFIVRVSSLTESNTDGCCSCRGIINSAVIIIDLPQVIIIFYILDIRWFNAASQIAFWLKRTTLPGATNMEALPTRLHGVPGKHFFAFSQPKNLKFQLPSPKNYQYLVSFLCQHSNSDIRLTSDSEEDPPQIDLSD